jgi:hypothetical protein
MNRLVISDLSFFQTEAIDSENIVGGTSISVTVPYGVGSATSSYGASYGASYGYTFDSENQSYSIYYGTNYSTAAAVSSAVAASDGYNSVSVTASVQLF